MDARQSGNMIWNITAVISAFLAAVLFVLTLVFFSQKQQLQVELTELEAETDQFIRPNERETARVSNLLDLAQEDNQSLVDYLIESKRSLANLAVGNEELSFEEARTRAREQAGLEGGSLLGRVEILSSRLDRVAQERDEALADARAAQEDLQAEIERLSRYEETIQGAVAQAESRVEGYQQDVQQYRRGIDDLETRLQRDLDAERAELQGRISDLESRVAELTDENLVLQETVSDLRGEGDGATISPRDEFALVDGEVISVDPLDGSAIISLGMGDKVSIGLTFSVYSDATALRPDPETGAYSEGKAVLEIIRINENSSRARVIEERRGNPVVAGDVIANPLYDPDKSYTFVVDGEFDTDGDGRSTRQERARLEALIAEWGGQVVDEIRGDVDFVVLGERPTLPPQPAAEVPREVLNQWIRLENRVRQYDELFAEAADTSIPVLSFNRLMTLIGEVPN